MAANNHNNVSEILPELSTSPYAVEDGLEAVEPSEVIVQHPDLPTSVSFPLIGFAEPTAFVLSIALLTKILKG
jgi:hypothetical protein